MSSLRANSAELKRVLENRVAELRSLTFDAALELPEAAGHEVVLGGKRCQLTVYRQWKTDGDDNALLVTAQVAVPVALGFPSRHVERGLVFSRNGVVREATDNELQVTGG